MINSLRETTPGSGIWTARTTLTATQARAATTGWLPDQKLGYAVNWNFGVQRSFLKDYVVDVRYLGTRGVHLLLQTMLNRVDRKSTRLNSSHT